MTGYSQRRAAAYSAEDLNTMTVSQVKALAADVGYSITKTKKADIIDEFLRQQEVTGIA